jgi:hypothetical protein
MPHPEDVAALLELSHHVMTPVEEYMDGYGPAVYDSISLWTQKCIFRVNGPK